MSGVSRLRPALRPSASRAYCACAQVSGLAEPAGWPVANPIEAIVGSRPERRGRQIRVLPGLLGLEALAGGHVAHRGQERAGAARFAGGDVVLAPLAGKDRPQVAGARVPRRSRMSSARACRQACSSSGRLEAVAVAVLGSGSGSCRSGRSPGRSGSWRSIVVVDDVSEAWTSGSLAGRTPRRTSSRKPASITDALVGGDAPVAEVVRDRGIRVAGLGEPDEVAGPARTVRSVVTVHALMLRAKSSAVAW